MRDLVLPAALDITTVEAVVDALRGKAATVDGGGVLRVDAIGLQALVATALHKSLAWKAWSAVIVDGARTLGLSQVLGLPLVMERG